VTEERRAEAEGELDAARAKGASPAEIWEAEAKLTEATRLARHAHVAQRGTGFDRRLEPNAQLMNVEHSGSDEDRRRDGVRDTERAPGDASRELAEADAANARDAAEKAV
jgi:hypothetical protein